MYICFIKLFTLISSSKTMIISNEFNWDKILKLKGKIFTVEVLKNAMNIDWPFFSPNKQCLNVYMLAYCSH